MSTVDPINGRIGTTLAGIKQASPVIWFVIVIIGMFGFKWVTPAEEAHDMKAKIENLQVRIDSTSANVSALVRLQCIKATQQEAKLAGLKCN